MNDSIFKFPEEDVKNLEQHEAAQSRYVELSQRLISKTNEQQSVKAALNKATLQGEDTSALIDKLSRLNIEVESLRTAAKHADYATMKGRYAALLKVDVEKTNDRLDKFNEDIIPMLRRQYKDYLEKELAEKIRSRRIGISPTPVPLPAGMPGLIIAALENRNPNGTRKIIG